MSIDRNALPSDSVSLLTSFRAMPVSNTVALVAFTIFFSFFLLRFSYGYGYDVDTYGMLRSWQEIVFNGIYRPSRFQGNIVAEFFIGFLASVGGAALSNFGVFFLSTLSLLISYHIAVLLSIRPAILVPTLLAANPYAMISAATSMDYMVSLFFFLFGVYFVLKQHTHLGVLCLAIAVGTRMPIFILAVVFLVLFCDTNKYSLIDSFELLIVLIFTSGLFYLPVWISSSLGFAWLDAALPDEQGFAGLVYRFAYKAIMLFGFAGIIAASIICLHKLRARSQVYHNRFALKISLPLIAVQLFIFFLAPIEISYLIPMIPFIAIALLAIDCRRAVIALTIGSLFHGVVMLDVLMIKYRDTGPCGPTQAIGAKIYPSIREGRLVEEMMNLSKQDVCYRERLVVPYEDYNSPLPSPQ